MGYLVQYRGKTEVDLMDHAIVPAGMTETTIMGLINAATYVVRVTALVGGKDSPEADVFGVIPVARPYARRMPDPPSGGQITKFELVGDVSEKAIAGTPRYHVKEGSQGVELSVTVQWTHEEIAAIGYNEPQRINVQIYGDTRPYQLPNWLSWIDREGDVHFPTSTVPGNLYGGVVTVRTPRLNEVPVAERGSARHVKSKTGKLPVLILHDDHEAENDAFYIQAIGGDVNLGVPASVDLTTPEVVIEDDEDQKVVILNERYTPGPTNVYEPAGDPDIDSSPSIPDLRKSREGRPSSRGSTGHGRSAGADRERGADLAGHGHGDVEQRRYR